MWTWTCTACGEVFARDKKRDAQAAFNDHATTQHNAKVVLSMEAGDSWT